jgi:hypothetical protein
MTRCIPTRTTDPPSPAPQPAAGGRLRHRQKIPLKATSASAEDSRCVPAGRENLVTMTVLAGLLEHSVVTRSVKSP